MDDSKNSLLNKLQEGMVFLKFNTDGSLNEGFFYICPKLTSLFYNISKKRFQNTTNECKDCLLFSPSSNLVRGFRSSERL